MTFRTDDIATLSQLCTPRVRSNTCSGSRSTQTLSTHRAGHPVPVAGPPVKSSDKDLRFGKRILLVDRNPARQDSLTDLLAAEGYFVIPAASAQQALKFANRLPVHLVLLDVDTPSKNNRNLFTQFTLGYPFIPIIVATAQATKVAASLGAGPDALLEKPVYIPRLLNTIETLLAGTSRRRVTRPAQKK